MEVKKRLVRFGFRWDNRRFDLRSNCWSSSAECCRLGHSCFYHAVCVPRHDIEPKFPSITYVVDYLSKARCTIVSYNISACRRNANLDECVTDNKHISK